ncbi:hypothetical protein T08_2368, partial [Trichinella sp. T8]
MREPTQENGRSEPGCLCQNCKTLKSGGFEDCLGADSCASWGPLAALSPFVDTKGLLRVGGRLSRTALPWCHRHPLLLPRNGPVVELIVRRTHESELHAGLNQTLAALRRHFWVVRGRQ